MNPSSSELRAAPAAPPASGTVRALASSFEEIYRAQIGFVWRICQRMRVREMNLDDVVQDVFVVVHRRLADFDGSVPLRSWIYGIVTRVVADHRRRFRRKESALTPMDSERNLGVETFASTIPPPEAGAEASEALSLVEALLLRLPDEKREVLVLSRLYDMSVPEIAAAVGGNVNTIYSRLRASEREFDEIFRAYRAQGETP